MLLTVSKRLEFSASRRLFVESWSAEQNRAVFGPETSARYGTGRNYIAFFVFSGNVNAKTGMLVNISEIKKRVGAVLHAKFDHKFLNEDNPTFSQLPPTAENIARQLFSETSDLFAGSETKLVACHLRESSDRSATAYGDGITEANYWFEFSATRQTMSPNLTPEENDKLFGIAASPLGHGHHYRARLTFRGNHLAKNLTYEAVETCLRSLRSELDHRNLNHEVAGLKSRPKTTESIARYIFERIEQSLPAHRIRLHERDDFFAEYWSDKSFYLGLQMRFNAAHRLHGENFSAEENAALYGKCNNPRGHGHGYVTEATVGGRYDERSGTLYDFAELQEGLRKSLQPWQDKHLDLEAEEFRHVPSTGENIVRALWPKIDNCLEQKLVRLRLWETANNRFTLRRI
ncbi:MAG TPA: 6-carboxytetrahydropterin synthase [Chthoniobacterales bacterium]